MALESRVPEPTVPPSRPVTSAPAQPKAPRSTAAPVQPKAAPAVPRKAGAPRKVVSPAPRNAVSPKPRAVVAPEPATAPLVAAEVTPLDTSRPASKTVAAAPARGAAGSLGSRAALALALLVGYYLLALLIVVALLGISFGELGRPGATRFAVFAIAVTVGIGRAVFAVEKRSADLESAGVMVSRGEQPALWALVDDVARETGFPVPDDLRLVEDVNAFVHQDTRLLGLVGGKRHLGIGTALLQVLTVDELRAVLAHELGHYAGGDTRLSALVYRAEATVRRTVDHLGPTTLLGRLFGAYATLYRRVSLSVRRGQELRADQASVKVAGRAAQESLLRELQAAAPAWQFFLNTYAKPVWSSGAAPRDLYEGFRLLLDEPTRQQELQELRLEDGRPTDPLDSHPSASERIALARTLPDRTAPGDTRSAREVLSGAQALEVRVTAWFHGQLLTAKERPLLDWDAPALTTAYAQPQRVTAAALAAATAQVDGGSAPAGLGRTLDLLEADRDVALVTAYTGNRSQAGAPGRWNDLVNLVTGPVYAAAAEALVSAGAARWQLSFATPLTLVDRRGRPLPLRPELAAAMDDDAWKPALRAALLRRKVALGDDAVPDVELPGEQRIAFLPTLVTRRRTYKLRAGKPYDGIITHDRLLAVPQPTWPLLTRIGFAFAKQYNLGQERFTTRRRADIEALLGLPLEDLATRPEVLTWCWDSLASVIIPAKDEKQWPLGLGEPGRPVQVFYSKVGPSSNEAAALFERLVGNRFRRV